MESMTGWHIKWCSTVSRRPICFSTAGKTYTCMPLWLATLACNLKVVTVLQALQVNNADKVRKAVHMHSVDTCYCLLKSCELEARRLQDIEAQHRMNDSQELIRKRNKTAHHLARGPQNGDVLAQHHTFKEQPPRHKT